MPGTTTGGGFGFGANNNTSSATTSGGLFGNKPTLGGATSGGGLFGGNNTSNTLGGGNSLFGNKPAGTTTGGFGFGGGSLQQNQLLLQQQQQQQQQQNQLPQLNAMTKVSDLPESFQKELEQLEEFISRQVTIAESLTNGEQEHKELIDSIPRDINFLENKYISTNQAINSDLKFTENFKSEILENFNDWVEKLIRVYLQLTNPVLTSNNSSVSSNNDSVNSKTVIGVNGFRTVKTDTIGGNGTSNGINGVSGGFLGSSSSTTTSSSVLGSNGNGTQSSNQNSNSNGTNTSDGKSSLLSLGLPPPLNITTTLNKFFLNKIENFKQDIEKHKIILQEVENSIYDLDKLSVNDMSISSNSNYGINMIVSSLKEEFQLYVELANELAEIHHEVKRLEGGLNSF
ncbi:unnamed protein product [[Candida] boidinii]|nr:unnamed protein product [[Candida] boidinii]